GASRSRSEVAQQLARRKANREPWGTATHKVRFAVPPGFTTARNLSVQTRSGAGCGLRHALTRRATRAPRSHRRYTREPVCGDNQEPTRIAGASLHRGRTDRKGCGPVGKRGAAVARTLGSGGSRRTTQAGPFSTGDPAEQRGDAPRADQAPSGAHHS